MSFGQYIEHSKNALVSEAVSSTCSERQERAARIIWILGGSGGTHAVRVEKNDEPQTLGKF